MAPVLQPRTIVREPNAVVMSGALGHRAAFLGALALPTLSAHADSIEEIAARNAAAAEAAKSSEVLAAKAAEEKAQENGSLYASAFITLLLGGATVISFPASGTND